MTQEEKQESKDFYIECKVVKMRKQIRMSEILERIGCNGSMSGKFNSGKVRAPGGWREKLKQIERSLPDRAFRPRRNEDKMIVVLYVSTKDVFYASKGDGTSLRQIGRSHPSYDKCKEIWAIEGKLNGSFC